MAINSDKPHRWKEDIAASVDLFNNWFLHFAPKAYRDTRVRVTKDVESALEITGDLTAIKPTVLRSNPEILPTLRMATCPPIARDRLIGLSYAKKNLVKVMEIGRLPVRMSSDELQANLQRIVDTISKMLDTDIFPWLDEERKASDQERYRASTIVADRLCGAVSDPIIRNAQEDRQLKLIRTYLERKGYKLKQPSSERPISEMKAGTFSFRTIVVVHPAEGRSVNIPIDVVIQPKSAKKGDMPILVEAKSAGDFTNTNKRRKEEATKVIQLRHTYGDEVRFILFLCGYFDGGYLGYEATENIDWIWEHRIDDFQQLGL